MTTFARRDDFMSGIHVIRSATAEKASAFVERYTGCPV